MIFLIGYLVVIALMGLGFISCKITDNRIGDDGFHIFPFMLALMLCLACTLAFPLANAVSYSNQIEDKYALLRTYEVEAINKDKAVTLTTQFATYLYEAYPQHEKDIFNKIQPESIDIYLVKYPELKASATIIKLVENISTLQTDYYDQKILRAKIKQNMLYRKHSPWLIKSIIPEYTDKLEEQTKESK